MIIVFTRMTSMKRCCNNNNNNRTESIDYDISEIGDNYELIRSTNIKLSNVDFIKTIRHVKCKVIKLANEQINRFNDRQAEIEARIIQANTIWYRIKKLRHFIAITFIVGILIWMSLVYGAILGASLCSNNGRSCFPFVTLSHLHNNNNNNNNNNNHHNQGSKIKHSFF